MDFRLLKTFIKVSELHSFSKAAQQLGYTQAAVSIQIASLEKEFNQIFFDRIGHKILLTEKGAEFLQYAQTITQLTNALTADFSDDAEISGNLRIGMTDSLCSTYTSDFFLDFCKKNPKVSIKIRTGSIDDLLNWLYHNEIDFVYTLDNHIRRPDLIILKEKEVPVCFYARASHPLFSKASITLEDLKNYPVYLTEKGFSYRNNLEQYLALQDMTIHPTIEIGNVHIIRHLLRQSEGIAFLPSFAAEETTNDELLRPLPFPELNISIWSQVICHRGKYLTRAMKEILNLLPFHLSK